MTSEDRPPLAIFDRCFSRHIRFTRFVLNVFLFSCLGLLPFLILYISLRPGFWSSLIAGPLARNLFLRQAATNELPVGYLINHVGFAHYATAISAYQLFIAAMRQSAEAQPKFFAPLASGRRSP